MSCGCSDNWPHRISFIELNDRWKRRTFGKSHFRCLLASRGVQSVERGRCLRAGKKEDNEYHAHLKNVGAYIYENIDVTFPFIVTAGENRDLIKHLFHLH
jgi:hypothetical protein